LGKILVVRVVLEEQGLEAKELALHGEKEGPVDYEKLVNQVFPRTFSCEKADSVSRASAKSISTYFQKLRLTLFRSGLVGSVLHSTCVEETAEKFCVKMEIVEEIVALSVG
jgi:hypothetical protein